MPMAGVAERIPPSGASRRVITRPTKEGQGCIIEKVNAPLHGHRSIVAREQDARYEAKTLGSGFRAARSPGMTKDFLRFTCGRVPHPARCAIAALCALPPTGEGFNKHPLRVSATPIGFRPSSPEGKSVRSVERPVAVLVLLA